MKLKAQDLVRALGIDAEAERLEDGLIRRVAGIQIKSVNEEARSVDVVASSEAIDSYDEIVVQDWDLSRYEKNPTVLYLHNAGGGFCGPQTKETFPVGYATNVAMLDGQLVATLNFVKENASPLAELCWQGFVQKSLRAVSVGFRPTDVKPGKVDGKDVYFLSGNQLFEISVVPIGANPEAVALSHQRNVSLLKARVAKALSPAKPGSPPAKPGQEQQIMNEEQLKELRAELERTKAALAIANEEIGKSKTVISEKDAQIAKLKSSANEAVAEHAKKLDELTERAEKAEGTAIELTIDSFVGKKITPAEKDDAIADAKELGLERVKSRIEKRPDLKLTERIVGEDPKITNKSSEKGGASARLAAAAKKSA